MKNILITGGSGGIGGAVANRFLEHGWHAHLLLRSFVNPEIQELMKKPNVSAYKSDPENKELTMETIQTIKNDGIVPDFVFHSAGTFLWDDGYPKEARPLVEVREILFRSNVRTKESVVKAIESLYNESLISIEQGFVGSHAADFTIDGPERTGKFTQEAYVEAMGIVKDMANTLRGSGRYKNIFLYQPGFVDTGLMGAFPEDRLGFKVLPNMITNPTKYAEEIFPEEFFTTRQ